MHEFAARFCTTAPRAALLNGLLAFRASLRAIGIVNCVQWINGSFCEDIEKTAGRPPNDIDLVSVFQRPPGVAADPLWAPFVNANRPLFDPVAVKAAHGCHAFFVDLNVPVVNALANITYWVQLFTHQRVTYLWKGIVAVPLVSDDANAQAYVASLTFPTP